MHHSRNCLGLVFAIFTLTSCSESGAGITIKGKSASSGGAGLLTVATSGSPTSLNMKIYAAYISAQQDCSDPILLQDHGSSGSTIDMFAVGGPTLFAGNPTAGTYPCLILKISDTMTFTVDSDAVADHAACTSTTATHTFDVYRDGNSDDGLNLDLNGVAVDARGSAASPVEDTFYVFASTGAASGVKANGVTISEYQYVNLRNALTVPSTLSFYFDMSDGVATHTESSVDYCWLEGTDSSGFGFE